ncbi:MAG: hypothetical protein VX916_01580 [Planctomycetota bacterium]|nr:hypothetical protein [Planctomycetota bacterium]
MGIPENVWSLLSVVGFLLLVGAYLLNQRGRTTPTSVRYLVANALGSGLLACYSAVIGEWVFVALEGFWCLASLFALIEARGGTARSDGETP